MREAAGIVVVMLSLLMVVYIVSNEMRAIRADIGRLETTLERFGDRLEILERHLPARYMPGRKISVFHTEIDTMPEPETTVEDLGIVPPLR